MRRPLVTVLVCGFAVLGTAGSAAAAGGPQNPLDELFADVTVLDMSGEQGASTDGAAITPRSDVQKQEQWSSQEQWGSQSQTQSNSRPQANGNHTWEDQWPGGQVQGQSTNQHQTNGQSKPGNWNVQQQSQDSVQHDVNHDVQSNSGDNAVQNGSSGNVGWIAATGWGR